MARSHTLALFSLAVAAACTGTIETDDLGDEDLDADGALADVELHEDVLTPADDVPQTDDVEVAPPEGGNPVIAARPLYQLPFPCGQVWAGQTRTNHTPYRAVDFNRAYDYGDTVTAAAGGTVSVVANYGSSGYGRWIEINHGNGYRTRYAHLSSQAVFKGQVVKAGQRIGAVGNTGNSTGAHLHFEERFNNAAVSAVFNGATALYFGTRSYRSYNRCL